VVIQKLATDIARKPPKLKDWNVYSFHTKTKLYYRGLSAPQSLFMKESPGIKTATIQKSTSSFSPLYSKSKLPTDLAKSVGHWLPGVLQALLPSWLWYTPSSENGYKGKGWVRQLSKEISTPGK